MPLPNARREKFAQALADGATSQSAAYARVYGGVESSTSVQTASARLAGVPEVAARVLWLQKAAADRVVEELGITRIGLCRRLLAVMDCSPLAVAMAVTKAADPKSIKSMLPAETALLSLADGVEPGIFGW